MRFKIPVYLDHHATTPLDPRVEKAMRPFFIRYFGNPASGQHSFGWEAEQGVEKARQEVASLIHAAPGEIYFTSGVTESNNWALKGIWEASRGEKDHFITVATEHKSILETMAYLETRGAKVTYLPVDSLGEIRLQDLEKAIGDRTLLISVMGAHNEVGTIPPLAAIGKMAKGHGVLFHTDLAQALGKIPIHVESMGIDLASLSSHKMYGPKGVGALYVRKRNPHVQICPLLQGGGQERGLRAGTLNVPAIVGFGKGCEIAEKEMEKEAKRLLRLRQRLYDGLCRELTGISLNGPPTERLPGNLNVSFTGVTADAVMAELHDVAISSGSACTSGSLEPSYVLRAMGISDELARASLRFGLGRFTTEKEIDFAIRRVVTVIKKLRSYHFDSFKMRKT